MVGAWAYFDGIEQGELPVGGVGGILDLSISYFLKLKKTQD